MNDAPEHGWTDEQVDQIIGNLLRWGVIVSMVVVMAGGALYLYRHGMERPDYRKFFQEKPGWTSIAGIIDLVARDRARGIIQFGLVLLIATPVARVLFSVFAFAVQRDWTYVLVTVIVLTVLLCSIFGLF